MKQNFHMGTYYEKECLVVKNKDGYAVIGDDGCIDHFVNTSNITNLRPVTVLDIAPEYLKDLLQRVISLEYSSRIDSPDRRGLTILRAQLTPTPAPKNEVGKVCVTEPNWGETISAYTNGNTKTEWLACTDPNTQKRIYTTVSGAKANWNDLIDAILLSEGVEE